MKRIDSVLILILLAAGLVSLQASAQPPKFKGGMMLHTGYLKNARAEQSIRGSCFGIGGKLSFAAGSHLRLGTEGYASTLGYSGQDGYYKLGWGGLLAEYQLLPQQSLHPVIGLTLGGGRIKDIFFLESDPEGAASHEVVYRHYAAFIATPSFSIEYALKTKLTLVLKVDYITPLFMENQEDFAFGPRIYFGVLFNRH